jgi:hypothetical protein
LSAALTGSAALGVGVAGVFPTVTRDDDMAVLEADTGVATGAEVGVTPVAGEAEKAAGKREAIALGDPPSPADVPARPLVVAHTRRLPGQVVEPLDALGRDAHTSASRPPGVCVVLFR